ncbi:MAG: hypothetical protein ACJ76F_02620 [Bacteroidia bacterium]
MFFRKKFNINLHTPCSESWEGMKPMENGRFCNSCAKKVIDFSIMSEKEIATYFSTYHGNSCGRMKASQLAISYTKPRQLQLPFHQRMLRFVLSFALLSKILGEKAIAQNDSAITQRDSSLIISNDSLAAAERVTNTDSSEETIPFEINTEAVIASVPTITIDLTDAIVCGRMGIVPATDPLVPDFGKSSDTMKQVAVIPGINGQAPQPPEKEEEKTDHSFWSAILPDRKGRNKIKIKNPGN